MRNKKRLFTKDVKASTSDSYQNGFAFFMDLLKFSILLV
jgi:hypothetical protein